MSERLAFRTVETTAGPVRGLSSDVDRFLGIPYAADPGGGNRFRPPLPPDPWTEPRDVTSYGPAFIQPQPAPDYLACFGAGPPAAMSEDALALNVWTPSADAIRRPVMVYIHGGGYFSGSGSELPVYDGSALARDHDVVVVTFNYRLGAFGFLHLGDIAPDEYARSGNAGLLDMVAALRWVRDNVAKFGGDPGNVTIFGSSAGGHAVTVLAAVPQVRGLFHRAVAQSGHALFCRSTEAASSITDAFLEAVGIKPEGIARLSQLTAYEILGGQARVAAALGGLPPTLLVGPMVDGDLLPASPAESPYLPSDVPLLIGSNGHEQECGGGVEQFANMWLSAGAAPVYVYRFTWQPGLRAGESIPEHGLELPFVFGNIDCPITGSGPHRQEIADRLGAIWATFARDGHPGMASWPPYRQGAPAIMALDAVCRIE